MGKGSAGSSTTTNNIPEELKGLTKQTAERLSYYQDQPGFTPVDYMKSNPVKVPGLTANQQSASAQAGDVGMQTGGENAAFGALRNAQGYAGQSGLATGADFANDPSIAAAYNAYVSQAKPGIENSY